RRRRAADRGVAGGRLPHRAGRHGLLRRGAGAGRDHADRRPRGHPRAVRQGPGQLPGRGPADRRRLRHRAHPRAGRDGRGVEPGGRARGRRGPGHGRLLVRRPAAGGHADLPPPARRTRRRHHLSDAPLLRADQGPVPAGRRRCPAAGHPRSARRPRTRCGGHVFIDLTDEQKALQAELREYFSTLISPEEAEIMVTERHGPTYREVIRRMGRDGWLGVGWPKEFGGKGFGEIEQQIFTNEAVRADVPLPSVTLQTVGPTLMVYGTEEQKEKFLPAILAGEVHFAIGYSEPDAGTDLAALTTKAVREGDEYIVNGQKIFTTGGHDADYLWLAVRTGTADSRHRGISILIMDTKDPGYSWTPIITADNAHHVNATYYEDVRVPANMLVGEENQGCRLITTRLNHGRVMLGPSGRVGGIYDRVRDWAQRPGPDGEPRLTQPSVRRALAEIQATYRLNELLNWQVASASGAV